MSVFEPEDLLHYKKTHPPLDDKSRLEYLDQQLRAIEKSVQHLVVATEQLQAEINLIWSVAGPRP